jgi:hypothetical protein
VTLFNISVADIPTLLSMQKLADDPLVNLRLRESHLPRHGKYIHRDDAICGP